MTLGKGDEAPRTRTVTWADPRQHVAVAGAMGGLDFLRAIRDGGLPPPPAAGLLGYRIQSVGEGMAVFEIEPAEYLYNPFGTVHGGIMGLMLDTAMTSAVMTTLSAGWLCSTIEYKVNFVRPLTAACGAVRSQGKTIHVGTRTATAEGRITGGDGTLYAHGISTCMIFRHRVR